MCNAFCSVLSLMKNYLFLCMPRQTSYASFNSPHHTLSRTQTGPPLTGSRNVQQMPSSANEEKNGFSCTMSSMEVTYSHLFTVI